MICETKKKAMPAAAHKEIKILKEMEVGMIYMGQDSRIGQTERCHGSRYEDSPPMYTCRIIKLRRRNKVLSRHQLRDSHIGGRIKWYFGFFFHEAPFIRTALATKPQIDELQGEYSTSLSGFMFDLRAEQRGAQDMLG